MEEVIFQETSTLGVRRLPVERRVLARKPHSVETVWGPIDGKIGWLYDGMPRFAPEFESCRRLAIEHKLPLCDVYETAQKAFDASKIKQ